MCEEQIVRNKGEAKEGLRWKHVEETDNLVIVNKSDWWDEINLKKKKKQEKRHTRHVIIKFAFSTNRFERLNNAKIAK